MASNIVEHEFEKLVVDIKGSEGPVFNLKGEFFMVAPCDIPGDIPTGQILKVDLKNRKTEVVCRPRFDGYNGIPAGLQCDKNNMLWVADMALGLLKLNPADGSCVQVVKEDRDGNRIQGCNDLIFDYDGNLWITAPAGPIMPHPDGHRISDKEPFGSVYCYTKNKEMIKIDTGYLFSNGIAVRHDENGKPSKLIVAETRTRLLWIYDILGPGKVANKRLWATLQGDKTTRCGPDGMDFDAEGNLLVTNHGWSMVEVYGPEGGEPICLIKCPFTTPSNVHFRPDSSELFITEHQYHGLWRFNWRAKGAPQYCDLQ